MKTFQEWIATKQLNEGRPADWQPTPRMNNNPFRSALAKVEDGEKRGEMPYTGNFAGIDAIQTRLGLDDEELQALRDSRLIARGPEGGWNVIKTNQQLPSPKMPSQPLGMQSVSQGHDEGIWNGNPSKTTRLAWLHGIGDEAFKFMQMNWKDLPPQIQKIASKSINSPSPFGQ
jgi:hypothetical protein